MIIGISGDPHGNINNIDVFKQYLCTLAKLEEQSDIIIILGDLFHNHSIVRVEILNLWLSYLKNVKIPYYLMVGNHDLPSSNISAFKSIHALEGFKFLENVMVVDDVGAISNKQHNVNLGFIPYCHDAKTFNEKIILLKDVDYLFCHQTFNGAKYDNGFYAPDGLPVELVSQFKLVISGHIHTQQQFANIWYPGSPYAMNFNDANSLKTLWTFNSNSGERKVIPTNLPEYIIKKINNINELQQWIESQDVKNKYKIILEDTKQNIDDFYESTTYRNLKEKFNIALTPEYTDKIVHEVKISDTLSIPEMLKKYINEIMPTSLNRSILLDKILKLINK